jgi:penicillin-insensitive murein endopeptidase
MPKRLLSADERETMAPQNMVNEKARLINAGAWTGGQFKLIRRAALDPRVARIFVNAAIKKQLCVSAGADRAWLGKVRPWWGHTYHFHVRLDCPADMASCVPQKAPPAGDGCGAELDAWLQPPKPVKPTKPTKPAVKPRPLMLTDLPAACREVLLGAPPGIKPQPTLAIAAPRTAPVQSADTSADDATENPVDAAVPPQRPNGTLY